MNDTYSELTYYTTLTTITQALLIATISGTAYHLRDSLLVTHHELLKDQIKNSEWNADLVKLGGKTTLDPPLFIKDAFCKECRLKTRITMNTLVNSHGATHCARCGDEMPHWLGIESGWLGTPEVSASKA